MGVRDCAACQPRVSSYNTVLELPNAVDGTVPKRVVFALLAWVLTGVFISVATDSLSLGRLFVISLIGYVVSVHVLVSPQDRPTWRSPIWWPIYIGLVVFGYVVFRRVVVFVPPEAF